MASSHGTFFFSFLRSSSLLRLTPSTIPPVCFSQGSQTVPFRFVWNTPYQTSPPQFNFSFCVLIYIPAFLQPPNQWAPPTAISSAWIPQNRLFHGSCWSSNQPAKPGRSTEKQTTREGERTRKETPPPQRKLDGWPFESAHPFLIPASIVSKGRTVTTGNTYTHLMCSPTSKRYPPL